MTRLAKETRDYFIKNFDKEAWGKVPWEPLSPYTRNSKTANLPILNVTGNLKNSTRNSIRLVTANKVLLVNDATDSRGRVYGNYHNEGTGDSAIGGYAYNPKRSFMKQNDELQRLQLKILREETGKIWQRV